jgi:hypothetical protein
VKRGAGRGLPQQLIAIGCTYLAIVLSYVPTVIADDPSPVAAVVAVVLSLGMPIVMLVNLPQDPSLVLWFLIIGIALWSAFRRTARLQLALQGPFQP